ncbi:uncharacterized protein LOC117747589 [Cyclopterus lumpus]|uniref:uncharacterized protein LOC117747589 n=1 Tax=Cyclopterus lumpus TaxID=8103 RepID=UPI00148653F5|nr:uncharacterized protein LOC117747589 [Cyclopterus lumpus]XP_034412847.1 uncharacterized protein LOC117747589 [Cyclopterus lumpus]XP_034412848.1 uncharacterized protein LOC117747589 [Cyclopterus lumpus]
MLLCGVLLLVSLASRVRGTFDPHHKPLRYRAEEGGNVTLEWRFSSRSDISVPSLKIHCLSLLKPKVFFHLDRRVNESLHEQFAGRVQCDQDALGTGWLRLRLSGVRIQDKGLYLCKMATGSGRKVKLFSLNVTAVNEPNPETTKPAPMTTRPVAEGRGRVGLYAALGLVVGLVVAAGIRHLFNNAVRKLEQPDRGGVSRRADVTSLLSAAETK